MNAITNVAPANDDSALTAPAVIETNSIMTKIIELASTPGINEAMVDRLIAWHEREQARQAMTAYNVAMSAAQGEIRAVTRNAYNDQTRSRFADLQAVDDAIRPIYTKHGFRLSFTETPDDAPEIKITCVVTRGSHVETYSLSALSDMAGFKGTPNKTSVQGTGSAVSYLRRYLTCMIFNVATRDDNDGNRQRPANTNDGELISGAQVEELRGLLAECSASPIADAERTFLDKMGLPDLRSIKEVPPQQFARCRNALLTKRANIQQRATRAA